jgi:hypothetical protein
MEWVDVIIVEEHVTSCKCAITVGLSDYLDEFLNTFWHLKEDYGLDVRLQDFNTEGSGAAQDLNLFALELFHCQCLIFLTSAFIVGCTWNSIFFKKCASSYVV